MNWLYPGFLLAVSVLVMLAERFWPWRREQVQLRRFLWSDVMHLVFNGHFLGAIFFGVATFHLLPGFDRWLADIGWTDAIYRSAAADWPLWVQIPVALLAIDFVHWCVHNLLHRVPFFWDFHKTHHSVQDGEMDWIVSFRFQWTEVVVYRVVQYVPLAWFGFAWEAVIVHATFGTLIGHLNHSNLDLGKTWLRYVLNSPRMHIWHHDYDRGASDTVNFGIIFSCWDWIFGTAYMPDHPPRKIGFEGVEDFPRDFLGQTLWPLQRWIPALTHQRVLAAGLGAVFVGFGYWVSQGGLASSPTPLFGEEAATSQPFDPRIDLSDAYSGTPEAATAALAAFGSAAKSAGWADPDSAVSVPELAKALGSPRLVLIDVRPFERFADGRIPTARWVKRSHYSAKDPVPGISRPPAELQALLRERGVKSDSVVVVYGDGGPEPYRLWWTLRTFAGYQVRVLDGGLKAWKAAGHGLAAGPYQTPAAGDVILTPPEKTPPQLWADLAPEAEGAVLLDTRSAIEHSGAEQHKKAARRGRIPGSKHIDWTTVLGEHDRLKPADGLRALFAPLGITAESRVITWCQSGTRSASVYYALHQLGWSEGLFNYDGSWAEYSRNTDLPVEADDA